MKTDYAKYEDIVRKQIQEEAAKTEPFSDEFVKAEIEFYGTKTYKNRADTVRIIIQKPFGALNEYFNKQFMLGQFDVPTLITRLPENMDPEERAEATWNAPSSMRNTPDEHHWGLWMSLTPMEIQSSYLPIQRAEGEVGTAGLGMGYFALRAAAKDSVESVTVFEKNADVIKYFKYRFKDRPYFKKIKIVEGDARENCKGYSFDFFFADIYRTLLPDETVSDMAIFCPNNDIQMYQFWGEERILLQSLMEEKIASNWLHWDERIFLQRWINDEERREMYDPYPTSMDGYVESYFKMAAKYTDREP